MQYEVKTISVFERQFKKLAKKYRSLKTDLESLVADLEKEPSIGTPLGKNCFKVRLSITSKNKGKSGGARVITHFIVNESNVYLGNYIQLLHFIFFLLFFLIFLECPWISVIKNRKS